MKPTALKFLILALSGCSNAVAEEQIAYLLPENAVYKEHFAKRGLRLMDAQRRRLAVNGKTIRRKKFADIATIAAPVLCQPRNAREPCDFSLQLGGRRLRYTDAQRRRLAIAAKKLGRKAAGSSTPW
jgi:hypothetical protein